MPLKVSLPRGEAIIAAGLARVKVFSRKETGFVRKDVFCDSMLSQTGGIVVFRPMEGE